MKSRLQRHEHAQAQQQLQQFDRMIRQQLSRSTRPAPEQAVGWARKRYRMMRNLHPGTTWEAALTPELRACLGVRSRAP